MTYDLAVIGAGWAGFRASLQARNRGLKACLIEEGALGGTCLNSGCIPTKTLVQSAKVYSQLKKAAGFGVELSEAKLDFLRVQERKGKIIQQLSSGMQSMLKGIDYIKARARLVSGSEIDAGGENIKAENIILATGSRPVELPGFRFDHNRINSSDDLLKARDIPRSLLIIGAGVVGCEFASLFAAFGSKVSLVEKMPQILPGEDEDIARKLEQLLKKRGVNLFTASDAGNFNIDSFERVLVCVGRRPNYEGLGLREIGIELKGDNIALDEYLRTSISNIYAAGDLTGKIMLAHYASFQGELACKNIINKDNPASITQAVVPSCIFTDPEVASCGLREAEAKKAGFDIAVRKFDYLGLGMARVMDECDGLVKLIIDKKTSCLIGASLIGAHSTEIIATLNLAITHGLDLEQLRKCIFAHPTISEAIVEAIG